MAEAAKRKGTALLAVMNENCTSCAGSPLCEVHCPVDDCINLLYEEMPGGGFKPYRVWVDNEKCIGCQMCYSDDLTKIHEHKTTGVVYFEYGNRMYDADKKLLEKEQEPKKSELQLIGTDSEDRLDKKICPWDAISMVEYEDALVLSKLYYDPELISTEGGVYSIDDKGKEELEDRQMEGF